jgi:hypothetical protein
LTVAGSVASGQAVAAVTRGVAGGSRCAVSSTRAAPGATPLTGICSYLSGRQGVAQVALFNNRTGRSYVLSTGRDKQVTASIVKVDILAQWLHRYQRHRTRIPAQIPFSIQYLMERMIEYSDNAAATALFYFHGGCRTLTSFNVLFPLTATKVGCQSRTYYGWGDTTTVAADQVALMKLFAYGRRPSILGRDARRYGLSLLKSIEPGEDWGLSCGPWGTTCSAPDYLYPIRGPVVPVRGVTVALKNGWKTLPTCTRSLAQCPWQVNSTGWVQGRGRDYVITVLTTRDPVGSGNFYGFNYGVDTIEHVSELVWANLK